MPVFSPILDEASDPPTFSNDQVWIVIPFPISEPLELFGFTVWVYWLTLIDFLRWYSIASLRSFIVKTGNLRRWSSSGRTGQTGSLRWDLDVKLRASLPQKIYLRFRAIGTLMAQSGTPPEAGAIANTFLVKDCDEAREVGYASGGWKRYLLFLEDPNFLHWQ